jgi:putative transposase
MCPFKGGNSNSSSLVPPYLKRAKNIDEFLPWLYLRGISTGYFSETLKHLLGADATGLSAATISRLKQDWEQDYQKWSRRDLSKKRYVYVWADGVYSNVRMDDRLCLLVIIGSDETGRKELLALSDGYRESAASWEEVLTDLKQRGLKMAPKLAIGDGSLGFWKAVTKLWPETDQQRCWVHKTANILEKLPKAMQPKVKEALHDIWQAETREEAYKAFDDCIERFSPKYPGAMDCLAKDKASMLAFYDYPAENWQHIRTTNPNPIESVFATVRLRTAKPKNCGSRITTLTMAFKLMQTAQKKWFRLRGYNLLADVINGVKFVNGIKQAEDQKQNAA